MIQIINMKTLNKINNKIYKNKKIIFNNNKIILILKINIFNL